MQFRSTRLTIETSTIYKGLAALRRLLYTAQFTMTAADRKLYGNAIMEEANNAMRYFVIAYERHEDKEMNLDECMAWFTLLSLDVWFCADANVFKFQKRRDDAGPLGHPDSVNTTKADIFLRIAETELAMRKWRNRLARGARPAPDEMPAD